MKLFARKVQKKWDWYKMPKFNVNAHGYFELVMQVDSDTEDNAVEVVLDKIVGSSVVITDFKDIGFNEIEEMKDAKV